MACVYYGRQNNRVATTPKWIFPVHDSNSTSTRFSIPATDTRGQWYRRQGHPRKFWFVENLGQIPESPDNMAPKVVWFEKMAPNVWRLFWRLYRKKVFMIFVGKSRTKTFQASFGKIRAKILRTPKICLLPPELGTDPESTPAGSCVFLSDQDPESKIWEKSEPEPLFHFSSRSLCGHFLSKSMGKFRPVATEGHSEAESL